MAIPCLVLVPLIPIGVGLLIAHWLTGRRSRKRGTLLAAITRGRLRMVWPVTFNSAFLRGEIDSAPGLVLAYLDDGPEIEDDHVLDLVGRLCNARPNSPDPLDRQLAAMMADLVYRPGRRRPLPAALSRERAIYLLDLAVRRTDLMADLQELPWIPCMVGPGKRGAILVVPPTVMAAAWRQQHA